MSLVSTFVFMVAIGGYVIALKFSADEYVDDRIAVTGRIFDTASGKALKDVEVTFLLPDVAQSSETYRQVITQEMGNFNIELPGSAKSGRIRVVKEGYWDMEGTYYFDSVTSGPKEVLLTLIMDSGFGKQDIHLQTIMQGGNLISLPVEPSDPNPKTFLKYYTSDPTQKDGYRKNNIPTIDKLTRVDKDTKQNIVLATDGTQFGNIEAGAGYVLQYDGSLPPVESYGSIPAEKSPGQTVLVKGTVPRNKAALSLGKAGKQLVGYPKDMPIRAKNLGIIINGEPTPFEDALNQGVIKNVHGWDSHDQKSVAYTASNLDTEFTPGSSYWFESSTDSVEISYGLNSTDSSDAIEIPENISLEDAQWVMNVDRSTLDEASLNRWNGIASSLINAVDQNVANRLDPMSDQIYFDNFSYFTKNNKEIAYSQNNVTSIRENTNIKLSSNIPSDCFSYKEMKMCFGIVDNKDMIPTGIYTEQFKNLFNLVAPEIENFLGMPPIGQQRPIWVTVRDLDKNSGEGGAFQGGAVIGGINVFYLSDEIFKNASGEYDWDFSNHPEIKGLITHELGHAWFGGNAFWAAKRTTQWGYTRGWIEGLTEYLEYLVCKKVGINSTGVAAAQDALRYTQAGTKLFMYTLTDRAWHESAGFSRYQYAMSSVDQMYAINHSIINIMAGELFSVAPIKTPIQAVEEVMPTMGFESFIKWYSYQWGGFVQIPTIALYGNPKIGNNPWAFAYESSSDPVVSSTKCKECLRVQLVSVLDRDGTLSQRPFQYESVIYKTTARDGKTGTYRDASYKGYSGGYFKRPDHKPDEYTRIDLAEKVSLEKGRKFSIVNKLIDKGQGKTAGKKYIVNEYYAKPFDSAGIYGTVAEAEDAGVVWIKPKGKSAKPFNIDYGYFQSNKDSEPDYGYNEGSYQVSYLAKDGKWRLYYINKTQGQSFIAIRTGRTSVPPEAYDELSIQDPKSLSQSNSLVKVVKAETTEPTWPDSLSINEDSIKKTIESDNSAKIEFKTSRPSFAQIEWGENEEYDQSTDFSDTFKPTFEDINAGHWINLPPLVSGKKYHFDILAVDIGGLPELTSNDAETQEEEYGEPTEMYGTGDLTISPFDILDGLASPQTTSATVSWKTSVATKGKVCYGETSSYGSCSELSGFTTDHSASIGGLKQGTTYHYQIYGETDDQTIRRSGDATFKTKSPNVIEVSHSGRWIGDDRAEVVFTTDKPATAKLKWWVSADSVQEKDFLAPAATQFRHEFPAYNDAVYYYSISALGTEEQGYPTGGGSGNFKTPMSIISSATPILVEEATQSYDVVFTWSTKWPAIGTVRYTGTSSGEVSCTTIGKICTATAHNVKPGIYTYTISASDPANPDITGSGNGTFEVDSLSFSIRLAYDWNAGKFTWTTTPAASTVVNATLRAQAETRDWDPITQSYRNFTACPVEASFSGVGQGEVVLVGSCAGQYVYRGEATIYDGVGNRVVPISFNYNYTYFQINIDPIISSASYITPLYGGVSKTYEKPIAFPWHLGSGASVLYQYAWLDYRTARIAYSNAVMGDPPTSTISFDRVVPYNNVSLAHGQTVWSGQLAGCPGVIAKIFFGQSYTDMCQFNWP